MLVAVCALSAGAYVVPPAAPRIAQARCEAPTMMARSEKEAKRRESALVTGTNWSPRTPPTPGKGYFFFQGPTPKTAVQKAAAEAKAEKEAGDKAAKEKAAEAKAAEKAAAAEAKAKAKAAPKPKAEKKEKKEKPARAEKAAKPAPAPKAAAPEP